MPVKMVATRACYVPSRHMEVKPNQNFEAADDREADRLTRQKRATRVVEDTKPAVPQRRKVLSLKDEPASGQVEPSSVTVGTGGAGQYRRRDMRAED